MFSGEPTRRTITPPLTPDELARLKRQGEALSAASEAEDELRVLLIEVARQMCKQQRIQMQSRSPLDYELTRITLRMANSDTINIAVYPGWLPQADVKAKPQPKPEAEDKPAEAQAQQATEATEAAPEVETRKGKK